MADTPSGSDGTLPPSPCSLASTIFEPKNWPFFLTPLTTRPFFYILFLVESVNLLDDLCGPSTEPPSPVVLRRKVGRPKKQPGQNGSYITPSQRIEGPLIRDPSMKSVWDFMLPKLPGRFVPSEIRRKDPAWRKDRYLKVFAATAGNPSIARYYAAWSAQEFRDVLAGDPDFQRDIDDEVAAIADRARFLLHQQLGLIAPTSWGGSEEDIEALKTLPTAQGAAISALIRVAEELRERGEIAAARESGERSVKRAVSFGSGHAPVPPVS